MAALRSEALARRRRATYQDVLDAPAHQVAETIGGTLHTHPRPAMPHALACSYLSDELVGPYGKGRGGPGGWWIVFEPELHCPPLSPVRAQWDAHDARTDRLRKSRQGEHTDGPGTRLCSPRVGRDVQDHLRLPAHGRGPVARVCRPGLGRGARLLDPAQGARGVRQ